ncbi:MAG: M4 family metallopeptidase [Bacteroidota bacterium]
MKKIVISLFFILFSAYLCAQVTGISQIAYSKSGTDWVKFREDKSLDPMKIFQYYGSAFGLTANDAMKLSKQETDNLGYIHYRYQQYYQEIPVRAGDYIIHAKDEKAVSGNGKIVTGLNISVMHQITSDEAINSAREYTDAESYMWENPAEEALLQQIKNDPAATYFPEPELMIADKKSSGIAADYKLVYKVDVYASKPLSRNYIFVDAVTGEVLFTENRLMTTDVEGVAVTKYVGIKNIWTDSVSPGVYRLRNAHYGNGVETYDMNKGTNYGTAVDFTDDDNYWDITTDQDDAATDAHFGAEMTYQYYFQKFGRLSYDNNNAKLLSYVHYDNAYSNAFWDGSRMTYGDGDGSQYTAFTSLDVTGHEITHAVDEYSANLVYQGESGALNEGFSDIFGTCIEFYADSATGDWFVGEDFDVAGDGFRNMADPKSDQLPDTYHGQYWVYSDVIDNGGVHTNCGPLTYWFYILSDGGSGTNDIGSVYSVTGLGIDSAADIAYRMLTVYLTSGATYADARLAALQSAEDLYGACSDAVIQTSNAMYAIGVGFPLADNDLHFMDVTDPETACGYSNAEYVSIRIKYNGCSYVIPLGDTIPVSYRVDGGSIVNDTIFLATQLNGGDTIDYTFSAMADFSVVGVHTIDCWVKYAYDGQAANDSIIGYQFENKLQQNIDVGVVTINNPVSACHMTNAENIGIEVQFFGCDSLVAGDSMVVAYRVNGGSPVRDTLELQNTLMPDATFTHVFDVPADLSVPGNYTIDAWTEYDPDTLTTNDMFSSYIVKNPINIQFDTIGFEETNINNLILVETTPYSHAYITPQAHNTGTKGFLMTGGNAMDYLDILEFPDGVNTWTINEFLSAKINFCVDATSWSSANLRFDLKQTNGGELYTMYMGAGDYTVASNFRILVNGAQLGGTYNPVTYDSDPFLTHFINLDSYAGTKFTLTFETRNIAKDTMGFNLDNAYVDEVVFSPYSQENVNDYANNSLNLGVYPNPFNDQLTVKYNSGTKETVKIEINDIFGKTINIMEWNIDMGTNKMNINLDNYSAGMYILKLTAANGFALKKIIKE